MDNHFSSGKILLLNKPEGISSYACVHRIKKLIPYKIKIGHTGTLDPFATGLLIICIGRSATKLVPKFMDVTKTYHAEMLLGTLTDTLDSTGTITKTESIEPITHNAIQQAINNFPRQYEQAPPAFSATKHNGRPLYELARNKTASAEELAAITNAKKKIVTLHTLSLLRYDFPQATISTTASKGTYIRVLVNDIAKKLGTIATTQKLHREAIGPFSCTMAHRLEELTNLEELLTLTIPIKELIEKHQELLG